MGTIAPPSNGSPPAVLQKLRPPTPKSSASSAANIAEMPEPPSNASSRKDSYSSRRSSLNFLRRSKSGDPVKNMKAPVVAPAAPKLPDLWASGPGGTKFTVPRSRAFGSDIRDSVDILSGKFDGNNDVPGPFREQYDRNNDIPNPFKGKVDRSDKQAPSYVPERKKVSASIGNGPQYVKTSSAALNEDPYAREGSMAHRGRYSYASTVASAINSPRRVRRRKDPTPFNILVIGASNSGKTSFLRFLRHSLAIRPKHGQKVHPDEHAELIGQESGVSTGGFQSSYLETEIDGERIGLTLWDSAGLEKNIVDLQLRDTIAFLENKFEETFTEETKVVRAPGVRDTHIHCVFLLLDPARLTPDNHYSGSIKNNGQVHQGGGLDEALDLSVLRALQGKTVVVPVISKADTCTLRHMEELKKVISRGLESAGIDPLAALELDLGEDVISEPDSNGRSRSPLVEVDEPTSDSEDRRHHHHHHHDVETKTTHSSSSSGCNSTIAKDSVRLVPLSILSPDGYVPDEPVGRRFAWGFADPYNEKHCDFIKLKEAVFSEWRGELREKSRDVWYENWRSERLGGETSVANRNRWI